MLGLRHDILNSQYHIFGQHSKCDKYFCTGKKIGEQNIVSEVIKCGLMTEMSIALRRVVNNSKSLLLDVDNNICEQFNSLINKHIGGKRVNFTQKQSYTTRVYAAVVSFNSNGNFIREIHKNITNKSPGNLYIYILFSVAYLEFFSPMKKLTNIVKKKVHI